MEVAATVEGIRPYLVHSEEYRVVYYSHDDDRETILNTQMSADALPADLRVGERIIVQYLLNLVISIRRA